jgi:hypothetical protein
VSEPEDSDTAETRPPRPSSEEITLGGRGSGDNHVTGHEQTRVSTPGVESESESRRRRVSHRGMHRYILGKEIARGGMGRVVEAEDTLLGRTVAVKEALMLDDALLQRFERETQITARLEHPSIVPVHDAGHSPSGAPYYVMRKVSGKPLEDLVRAAYSLSERLALLTHVLAAANAVAHAHGRGVIHRDLKPNNILVGKLGETVVIDWGLGKVIGEVEEVGQPTIRGDDIDTLRTRHGELVGTPGFMSPEQLRGKPVDERADVYALGATLYYLLARRIPHEAKTGDDIIRAALSGPPKPVRDLVPGVPPELATIVERALAPGLDVRYRDAAGFAADLEQFLKGRLVASHRYSRRERAARWVRRHRLAVSVAMVALLAIAVGSTISIVRIVRERDRADRALALSRARNEQLQLSHAMTLVKSHPTGAVALARPLASGHWQTARSLAMAARSLGVAYGLPASAFTRSLEMANDGIRVLSAGDDGVIRIYDLRSRSSRVLARLGSDTRATWADNETQIVAWTQKRIVVIPVAGGTASEVALESEPTRLRMGGGKQLAWCDVDGAVWTMSLTALQPLRVDTGGDKVDHLAVHGDTFALGGAKSTFLFGPTGVRTVIAGHARQFAFSRSGKLAAILDDYRGPLQIVEFDRGGGVVSTTEYPDAYTLLWQEDLLWVGSERGLGTRVAIDVQVRGGVTELIEGPSGALIARTPSSAFTVFDHKVIAEIPPTYAIHGLATRTNSGFMTAGSDRVLLVWTLEDFRPQTIPLQASAFWLWTDADQMIAIHDDKRGTWIDLGSLERTPITLPGPIRTIVFAPDGSSALVVTHAKSGVLYRRGAPGSTLLRTDVTAAAFATPTEIVIGTDDGAVRTIDLAGTPVRELSAGNAAIGGLDIRGEWIAAHLAGGKLVRMRRDGSARTSLPADHKALWFKQLENGAIAYTDFSELHVWNPDDSLMPYPGLPPPVSAVEVIGPDSFIVYTGGDSAHLVELGGRGRVAAVYPPGLKMEMLRFEGDHGVYLSPDGSLFETSPRTGIYWRVATARRERFVGPTLSRDRKRLFAIAGDRLLVWKHVLPANAVETHALFDALTNAQPTPEVDALDVSAPMLRMRWD